MKIVEEKTNDKQKKGDQLAAVAEKEESMESISSDTAKSHSLTNSVSQSKTASKELSRNLTSKLTS